MIAADVGLGPSVVAALCSGLLLTPRRFCYDG